MTSTNSHQLRRIYHEVRALAQLGLPLIGAQLAQVSLAFIDTVMAGNLSAEDLAVVAMGSAIWVPAMLTAMGILMALSPTVAHQFGRSKTPGPAIGESLRQSLWIAVGLALILFLALRHLTPMLQLAGVSAELIDGVNGYLRAVAWGTPGLLLFLALRFLNEGCGNTRPVLMVNLLIIPANIVGNAVLMYGLLGFPAMGAIGCGWSSAVVMWLQALLLFLYVRRSPRFRLLGPITLPGPDWPAIGALLRLGLPIGTSIFLEAGLFAAVAIAMGRLGTLPMAAHQVAVNFSALAFMVPVGLSGAIAIRVGHAAGRGELNQVRFVGRCGIVTSGLLMSLSATFMVLAPAAIIRLYTGDPAVAAIAVNLLAMAALFQLSDGLQVAAAGALRGFKDTHIPMWLTLFSYWCVGFPLSYYFGLTLAWGPTGLWVGLIGGLTTAAILLNLRFHYISRTPGAATP